MVRKFEIAGGYCLEAAARARSGRPISAALQAAQRVIKERGWAPPRPDGHPFTASGPVDVLTAVRIAWGGHESAPLELMDYYAVLAPIASVCSPSFGRWERQGAIDVSLVLETLDEAIAFAFQAERSVPGPTASQF